MGVDMYPTCNQEVKSTPLEEVVNRTMCTQTQAEESLEPENEQSTTYIKKANYLLEVCSASRKNKQRRVRLSNGRRPSVFQKQTTRVPKVC